MSGLNCLNIVQIAVRMVAFSLGTGIERYAGFHAKLLLSLMFQGFYAAAVQKRKFH